MSTLTQAPTRATAAKIGLTFGGVLRSEWIKFRSLRSTQLLLVFTFLAMVGVGTLAAWLRGQVVHSIMDGDSVGGGPSGPAEGGSGTHMNVDQAIAAANSAGLNIYGIPIAGIQLGILLLGALAVLLIASEFGTGMIRSTFAAVPTRTPVFFAKAIVLAVVSYVLTLAASLVTFLISLPIMNSYGVTMSLGMKGTLYSILMAGVYVAGVAIIGLSLGTLMRNSAGAIVVLVALFFLLEIATQFLGLIPGDFWKYVGQYIPSVAGGRMLEIGDKTASITPMAGGFIFLAWILVITIPAVIALKKRDV